MLTTMPAALAHAPAAVPFNANFYITAATVIPAGAIGVLTAVTAFAMPYTSWSRSLVA